jgi:hypothetical protein
VSRLDALQCTWVGNRSPVGAHVSVDSTKTLEADHCILSHGVVGEAVACKDALAWLSCSDVFGNEGGNFVGCLDGLRGVDGNLEADPAFCEITAGDYSLSDTSPCFPGHHPDGAVCGLIGARGAGACGGFVSVPPRVDTSASRSLRVRPVVTRGPVRILSPSASLVQVTIVAAAGRVVRRLWVSASDATWDLTDHRGVRVPPGVYQVRPMKEAGLRGASIVVIR